MAGWSDIWSGSSLGGGSGGGLGGYGSIGGWTDIFSGGGGGGGGGAFDWTDAAQGIYDGVAGGSGGSGGGGWMQSIGNLFSNDGQGGGGYSDIFGAMLGGLGGAAQAFMDKDALEQAGKEQRRTLGYGAALEDYYKQQDTARKRVALDTYGQFSLMDRWAPNYRPPARPAPPAKPEA